MVGWLDGLTQLKRIVIRLQRLVEFCLQDIDGGLPQTRFALWDTCRGCHGDEKRNGWSLGKTQLCNLSNCSTVEFLKLFFATELDVWWYSHCQLDKLQSWTRNCHHH